MTAGPKMLRLIEDVHHVEVYMKDSRMVKFFPKDLQDAPPKEEGIYAYDGKEWRNVFSLREGMTFEIHGPPITQEKK